MERSTALDAVFQPVQAPTTFEETVERLGTAIRLGLLPPGSRLPAERELSGQLRISRSTLRQALTTLVQSGHLISVRGRAGGTFVAELAAERAEEEDLVPLDTLVRRMATAEAFEDYRRADVRFHIGVAEATHSPRLVAAMTDIQGQMSDLIARIAHPPEVLKRSNEQHRRLVALLRRRDAGRAMRLIREHVAGTEHILAGLLPPGAS